MIVDTHSHLNFKAYEKDINEVLRRTEEADITCINVGTKLETSKKAVEMAEKNNNMFAAIGLHPIHIKTDLMKIRTDESEGGFTPAGELFSEEEYEKLVLSDSRRVVAIGEVGLDYYYKPKIKAKLEQFKNSQKEVFLQQLNFAKKVNLPLIIHCRVAHKDMITILKEESFNKGVIHCFTGSVEEMKEYIKLGFHIGINGIIFKLSLDEVIKDCPLDRILVETDCPYLTPIQEGDKRNEPIFIKHTIQKIAEIKGLSFEEICLKTTENAKGLFNI